MGVTIEQGIQSLALIVSGSAAAKIIEMLQRRHQMREPASLTAAAAEFQDALNDSGKEILNQLRKELNWCRRNIVKLTDRAEKLSARAEQAEEHRDRCDAELITVKADLELSKQDQEALRRMIIELSAGRVALPGERAPVDHKPLGETG